jgi:hypothetical protein
VSTSTSSTECDFFTTNRLELFLGTSEIFTLGGGTRVCT